MQELAGILAMVPSEALPWVVLILGGLFIYLKFRKVDDSRKATKESRDKDSLEIHDKLLDHEYRIKGAEQVAELHKERLVNIDSTVHDMQMELVKLNTQVGSLVKALEAQNKLIMEQMAGAK